jgi:peptidoglycan/LPS O-acetylase OafA/YrhL
MTELNRFCNNFDFLRFFAATMVIFAHCYPLLFGLTCLDPFTMVNYSGITSGTLAVYIFFIISGYLITLSWEKDPFLDNFFVKRILRIYPGYIVVVFGTSFILGVILTNLTLFEYFRNFDYFGFVYNFLLLKQVYLPGVFQSNPVPGAVNGSLWILLWEFKMYVLIAFLGFFGFLNKKNIILLIIVYSAVWYSWEMKLLVIQNTIVLNALLSPFPLYFLIGTFFAFNRERDYDYRIAILLLIAWILTLKSIIFILFSFIAIPYVILTFAHTKIPVINKFGIYGDFSYGLYIFAFPIQQIIVMAAGKHLTIFTFFISSFFITLGCAILSWKMIESRVLALKTRFLRHHSLPNPGLKTL